MRCGTMGTSTESANFTLWSPNFYGFPVLARPMFACSLQKYSSAQTRLPSIITTSSCSKSFNLSPPLIDESHNKTPFLNREVEITIPFYIHFVRFLKSSSLILMASLQMLKSSSSFSFSFPQNDFRLCAAELSSLPCRRRILKLPNTRPRGLRTCLPTKLRVSSKLTKGENQSNGEEPPESLFMKELRRRGMTPTSLLEEGNRSVSQEVETNFKEEDSSFQRRNAVSIDSGRNLTNQREQSMSLNSEGLEGLIPRAKVLLTLGGTFFLAFWPLILVTVVFFSGLYLYFGPIFVHDASTRPIAPPQYIDPYALLEEERISQIAPPLN